VENKKGANLTHPSWRHHEAPWGEIRQAAPSGACLDWYLPVWKFVVFQEEP